MPSLPVDGASAWGDTLNAYLTALDTEANTTQTGLNNHASNSPADPHQDRAYALSLVNPITTGVNAPNGYVKLNSSGYVPSALVNGSAALGGAYFGVFDAVTMYGATPNNGLDQSAAIQAAINAAGSAGGGIVYIGPGTFSLANYLIMATNVHLVMSEGTVLSRITGTTNTLYMITNVLVGSGNTPASNVHISGGMINTYGTQGITSACTAIYMVQPGTFLNVPTCYISGVRFYNHWSFIGIYLNGSVGAIIKDCAFTGVQAAANQTLTNSAIQLNGTFNIAITNCFTEQLFNGTLGGTYGYLVAGLSNGPVQTTVTGCSTGYPSTNNIPINLNSLSWVDSVFSGNAWSEYPITPNVWNDLRPLSGSFTGTISGQYPPQLRMTPDGTVQLVGSVTIPGSYNGVNFATVPSGLIPKHPIYVPVAAANAAGSPMTDPAGILINTSGNMQFHNLPTGLSSGTEIWFSASWPSDFSGLIQS